MKIRSEFILASPLCEIRSSNLSVTHNKIKINIFLINILIIFDHFRSILTIFDRSWLLLTTPDLSGPLLTVPDHSWPLLTVNGQVMIVPYWRSTLTVRIDQKSRFWTSLVVFILIEQSKLYKTMHIYQFYIPFWYENQLQSWRFSRLKAVKIELKGLLLDCKTKKTIYLIQNFMTI